MNTADRAHELLQRLYGHHQFRGDQLAIIETVVAGDSALVLMPTGGGKSVCYQLPALLRSGTGVVVSPLIALMQDQVDALAAMGVRAGFINSSQQSGEQQQVESDLRSGNLDILYVAPERLLMPRTLALLETLPLALFAIDEAHCVSQWGHDFRPEYMGLGLLAERFPHVPRLALTATADGPTRDEIASQLHLQQARRYVASFDRPNIHYHIREANNGKDALWQFLQQEHPEDAGIVYCLSRKKVDDVAAWLNEKGRQALPYHAGMSNAQRREHQRRFLVEDGVIVVATIAFGMGIDKPDVRFVAHLNLPKSIEAYYQETGRAGRDGESADAWMTYGLQDVINLRNMLGQSDADAGHKRVEGQKLEAMLGLAESVHCRRRTLLNYFGETQAGTESGCGNCDNCLLPQETIDATREAQMALSTAWRAGQRFGVSHLVSVLRGDTSERLQRTGHDQLSTYGIGSHLSANEWKSVFRQLIARGLLFADIANYGVLKLTESARPVLRGEEILMLRSWKREPTRKRRKALDENPLAGDDADLFEALRECRSQLAREHGMPPYVVFHDRTLIEMARLRPTDHAQMQQISGVGEKKLELYADDFIAIIRTASERAATV